MTRALLYTRVSTTDQAEEGTSLTSQLEACRRHAAEHQYHIVGEYRDVFSGAYYRERPGLSELRGHVRANAADVVLVYALDRLSRDQLHTAVLLDEFEHHGARLELVTEAFDDTPTGRLIRSVQSFVAEIEREKIAERSSRGRRARVESGRMLPGPKPRYGYLLNDGRDGYVIDPDTAPVVHRILTAYADGASLRSIARSLTHDAIPPPTGPLRPWSVGTVHYILKQPAYAGHATGWGGEIELPAGTIPPIVDVPTWKRVQMRLKVGRERAPRNNRNPQAALLRGGIGRCGLCGRALVVIHRRSSGSYEYQCNKRSRGCRPHSMATHHLDAEVLQELQRMFLDGGVIQRQVEKELLDVDVHHLKALQTKRADLERQQAALSDAIAMATDTDAITMLVERLELVSSQLRTLSDEQRAMDVESGLAEQRQRELEYIQNQQQLIANNFNTLPYSEQRDVLDSLQITVRLWPATRTPRRWDMYSPLLGPIVSS